MKLEKEYTTSVQLKIATRVHSTKERPEVSSRGVVVEYIDRAHRATLEIFAQHLPLTLHNAAKLGHFSMGSNGRWSTSEHTRTSNGSIRARSLPPVMFMKRNLMQITIMASEMGHVSLVFECTRVPIFNWTEVVIINSSWCSSLERNLLSRIHLHAF